MKLSLTQIRVLIENIIIEHVGMHKTLVGDVVSSDSAECYDDVCSRIEDLTHARNQCPKGSASRSNYNGILSNLRTKKNRLHKIHGPELENKT